MDTYQQAIAYSIHTSRQVWVCKRGKIVFINLAMRKKSRLICVVCGNEIIRSKYCESQITNFN